MEARDLALTNGIGRALIGAVLVAAPRTITRTWVGPSDAVDPDVLGRALGARDLALGAGLVWAVRRGEPAHAWCVAATLADTVDAGATLALWKSLPAPGRALVVAVAVGSAVQMAALSARVDR